jgi:3-oxoacyl-[acyl-carrier protein] reductase
MMTQSGCGSERPEPVALITGASRGIGKATALLLAEHGFNLAINGMNPESLETLAVLIRRLGRECLIVKGDISEPDTVSSIVSGTVDLFGKIDVLINNAGITRRISFETMPLAEWERVIRVNLTGTMLCCQTVLPLMKRARRGRIINVASVAAKKLNLSASPCYGASKAGILYLTRHLAAEYAKYGIYVNAVCPGPVKTDMTSEWTENYRDKVISDVPLQRLGSPEEIAKTILFLCVDSSGFIVGEAINVNGGTWMD